MNVNELRDRILEISHNEVAADTSLKTKALSWLNSAYHEIVSDCLPYLEQFLETSYVLSIESGSADLPSDVARILKVVDVERNAVLPQISLADSASMIGNSASEGTAKLFWVESGKIFTNTKFTGNLKLVYLKQVPDLLDGNTEEEIVIPKQFHHGLVWGGLVWSSIFERGFSSQSDLKLFQLKWEKIKADLKLSLASQPMKVTRVKAYDL